MLFCSKCGFPLRRRTWNSKLKCRKIVWQCSNYIRNGKASCTGTSIDDEVISSLNIVEETIVKEVRKDGKNITFIPARTRNTNLAENLMPQKRRWPLIAEYRQTN